MAVLWRGMENNGKPQTGYYDDSLTLKGALADKNTFFEKHVRISNPLPSDTKMKEEVKRVWTDRQKRDNARVLGQRGTRTKKEVYGGGGASGSGILFVTLEAFMATSAWIEENVKKGGGKVKVPLLGGATVVTWTEDTFQYEVVDAGHMYLGIRIGNEAFVEFGESDYAQEQDLGANMRSKIVYHWDSVVRGV
jgi:hypothetical protein